MAIPRIRPIELRETTRWAALAMGVALILLFVCIFRTSNATTLVILVSFAILGAVSILSASRVRYLLLAFLTGMLALELVLYHEGNPAGVSGLFMFSVLFRFVIAGLLIAYFASIVSQQSQKLYIDMTRLADEREEALLQSNRWLSRLNALLGIISPISTKNELEEVLREGLEQTRKVFDADSGLIYRVGRKTGRLVIMSSFGYSPELLDKMKEKGVTFASSCRACSSLEPVAVDNLLTDDKCANLARVNSGSSICLPVASEEKLWGVLHLRRASSDAFTAEDIQLAQAIAYQFALAMQRAYLFDEVNLLAITDPLTELYNYRKMTRDLEREIVRSRRYRHPFSFIMADIDHFKDFNDMYGHQAGDMVLREVARLLDSGRREVDRVYRYGGEEFTMLLPETGVDEAVVVAEKLRGLIESLDIEMDGDSSPIKITISLGVATFPRDSRDVESLVVAADGALYTAKERGRNMAVAYPDLEADEEKKPQAQTELKFSTD
jgi:diguanylate cyclase (GGDEF)-like protein